MACSASEKAESDPCMRGHMVIIHLTNEEENVLPNLLCVFQSLLVTSFSALHKNRIMTESKFFSLWKREKFRSSV